MIALNLTQDLPESQLEEEEKELLPFIHVIHVFYFFLIIFYPLLSNIWLLCMNITSPAFENNGRIPDKYTCFGQDVNPPLRFEDVPKDTASLILTVTDPDVPGKTFIHWLVYNIDPSETGVEEDSIPEGGIEGMNDFGEIGYSGPCPPTNTGTHHYHFTLYALDTELNFHEGALYEDIMDAIEPHVIDNAELIGTYSA